MDGYVKFTGRYDNGYFHGEIDCGNVFLTGCFGRDMAGIYRYLVDSFGDMPEKPSAVRLRSATSGIRFADLELMALCLNEDSGLGIEFKV